MALLSPPRRCWNRYWFDSFNYDWAGIHLISPNGFFLFEKNNVGLTNLKFTSGLMIIYPHLTLRILDLSPVVLRYLPKMVCIILQGPQPSSEDNPQYRCIAIDILLKCFFVLCHSFPDCNSYNKSRAANQFQHSNFYHRRTIKESKEF